MIYVLNDSLTNREILYKYDDATFICKQGRIITIYFDCIARGFDYLQNYLVQHAEYRPFAQVIGVYPAWNLGENAKYFGYVKIATDGLIYLKALLSNYPNIFSDLSASMGFSGSISYLI